MPKVSIIMPVYNGERFIRETIDSVLAQTWQDWELIIVNDGSTDGTAAVIRGFSDKRLVIIEQQNRGEGGARNTGLDRAQGEFIAFLDADDVYLPDALADQVGFLRAHPEFDVSLSDGYFCDARGQRMSRLSGSRPGPYTGDILESLVLNAAVVGACCSTMTRRASIESHYLRFDTTIVIGTDYDFWISLARFARFGYVDKPTCMYRIHDTNVTVRSGRSKRQSDLLFARNKVMQAGWFSDLTASTRYQFFYGLLVGMLSAEPEAQRSILASPQFLALSQRAQSELLRHVATCHLRSKTSWEFGVECLNQSVQLNPNDGKTRVLLGAARWKSAHQSSPHAVAIGLQSRPASDVLAQTPAASSAGQPCPPGRLSGQYEQQ